MEEEVKESRHLSELKQQLGEQEMRIESEREITKLSLKLDLQKLEEEPESSDGSGGST